MCAEFPSRPDRETVGGEQMRLLADTSFLIAALIEKHPHHPRTVPWLKKVSRKDVELAIASHSLAEVYGILTSLPISPRIPPGTAFQLINENLVSRNQVIDLRTADYLRAIRMAAEKGLHGGVMYDILLGVAFEKSKAEAILTFNQRDFLRIFPDRAEVVLIP